MFEANRYTATNYLNLERFICIHLESGMMYSAQTALTVAHDSTGGQWGVGYLRATTLIPDLSANRVVENTWWEKIVGDKPEEEHISHHEGVKEQKGSLNSNLLAMISHPGRVDWILEVTKDVLPEPSDLPTIGPMSGDTLKSFEGIVKDWLDVCPSVDRLAFGVVLGKPAADAHAGYKEILQYLRYVQLDPHDISDFFYQINRPRVQGQTGHPDQPPKQVVCTVG